MRHLTPILLAGVLLVGPAAGQASAVTITDLINLKANGLSDQLLIALIESDGSVFRLSADDVIDLRKRGLSETVLIAMLLTAKKPVREVAAEPASVFVENNGEFRQDRTVQSSQPGTVNVHQTVTQTVEQTQRETETVYVPVAYAVPVVVAAPLRHRVEPVYWGFGGARRADSWKEPDRKLDPKPDPKTESKPSTATVKTDDAKPASSAAKNVVR